VLLYVEAARASAATQQLVSFCDAIKGEIHMKVTVKLFANFRLGRFKVREQELPVPSSCGDVVASLTIPEPEIGIVLVNGRHAPLAQTLNEGDTLSLFPLVGGG
jgi:sulfur carrier protein ThiS